jgi:hypothetical protein
MTVSCQYRKFRTRRCGVGRSSETILAFQVRPNGVTIRRQGTKATVKTLATRDRRSPLTTWRMSRIAKGSYPLFSKTSAGADSQKRRSPVSLRIASRARNREGGADAGAFLPERGFVMRNHIDVDPKHSRAIVQEIGERLSAVLKEEPECPGSLRTQIDRLRELEEQSPSIVPVAKRWDKRRR